jgi:hypothetical protein
LQKKAAIVGCHTPSACESETFGFAIITYSVSQHSFDLAEDLVVFKQALADGT